MSNSFGPYGKPFSFNPYEGGNFNYFGDNYPGNRYATPYNAGPFGNRFAYGYGGEPSMRAELFRTLDGDMLETPKARPALIRKARLDIHGNPIVCVCVNPDTHEPDRDTYCPFCVTSDTLVRTSNGLKEMIDIQVGDLVMGKRCSVPYSH